MDPIECQFFGQNKGNLLGLTEGTDALTTVWMAMFGPQNVGGGLEYAATVYFSLPFYFYSPLVKYAKSHVISKSHVMTCPNH